MLVIRKPYLYHQIEILNHFMHCNDAFFSFVNDIHSVWKRPHRTEWQSSRCRSYRFNDRVCEKLDHLYFTCCLDTFPVTLSCVSVCLALALVSMADASESRKAFWDWVTKHISFLLFSWFQSLMKLWLYRLPLAPLPSHTHTRYLFKELVYQSNALILFN